MKQLLIIRHAKSSWANAGQDDFDRPLNDRGMRDAPVMAQRLLDREVKIDLLLSSAAKRALSTARYFAAAYHFGNERLVSTRKLYHAYPDTFYEVIGEIDDSVRTVAVFAHNPGITYFANQLSDARIDDMPTCGIFAITTDAAHWNDLREANKWFWFFDYPKL